MFLQRKHLGCPQGLYKDALSLVIEKIKRWLKSKSQAAAGADENKERAFQSLFFVCDKTP